MNYGVYRYKRPQKLLLAKEAAVWRDRKDLMVVIGALPVVRFLLALHYPLVFLEDTLGEPYTSDGHAASRMPGIFGRRMDSRPKVRLIRCSASSGTYAIHTEGDSTCRLTMYRRVDTSGGNV